MFHLSQSGVLPQCLQKIQYHAPFCAGCAFGKAHCRQWRHKGSRGPGIHSLSHNVPGACVSVDQLVSAQPGLMSQVSGHLT